jgi:hypothetical protein
LQVVAANAYERALSKLNPGQTRLALAGTGEGRLLPTPLSYPGRCLDDSALV